MLYRVGLADKSNKISRAARDKTAILASRDKRDASERQRRRKRGRARGRMQTKHADAFPRRVSFRAVGFSATPAPVSSSSSSFTYLRSSHSTQQSIPYRTETYCRNNGASGEKRGRKRRRVRYKATFRKGGEETIQLRVSLLSSSPLLPPPHLSVPFPTHFCFRGEAIRRSSSAFVVGVCDSEESSRLRRRRWWIIFSRNP